MRGFRFRLSLSRLRPKTCLLAADEAPRGTREKASGTKGKVRSIIPSNS